MALGSGLWRATTTTTTTTAGMHDDKILQGHYTIPITRVQVFGSRRLACSTPRKPHNGLDSVSAVFGTAVQKTCRKRAEVRTRTVCGRAKGVGWPETANSYKRPRDAEHIGKAEVMGAHACMEGDR